MIIKSLSSFGINEDHIQHLSMWFESGYVHLSDGTKTDIALCLEHKHDILVKIWSSRQIENSQKLKCMEQLESLDSANRVLKT